MATADQLKSLIKSHFEEDRERFSTIALQVAAHEARQGHSAVAHEIRSLVDRAQSQHLRILPFRREIDDLIMIKEPSTRLSDIIVAEETRKRIERILREYRQQEKLSKHGMEHRRKLLLTGPPGTGKTMTASILAGELHLPLYTILMDRLVTKYMGETSAKLRLIFDAMQEQHGVYLFDEFDAIGAERGLDNDVGEIRRILNSFLQYIELDCSESLIVAATNNIKILDQALFRRFDDALHYTLPIEEEITCLISNRLGAFMDNSFILATVGVAALSLSHAEITQACDDAIKEAILDDKPTVSTILLLRMLNDHQAAYDTRRGG